MKSPLVVALSLFALSAAHPALAAGSHDHGGMHHTAAPAAALAEGTVKKLDKAKGSVTIAHGPLEALNMPPMTMAFKVMPLEQLDKLKVGDKLRFRPSENKGELIASDIEVLR